MNNVSQVVCVVVNQFTVGVYEIHRGEYLKALSDVDNWIFSTIINLDRSYYRASIP